MKTFLILVFVTSLALLAGYIENKQPEIIPCRQTSTPQACQQELDYYHKDNQGRPIYEVIYYPETHIFQGELINN